MMEELPSSSTAINSENIGFQLLKKHGWKEGTGLGIAEQGRLEPVQTYMKNNKRGIGAEKVKKKAGKPPGPGDGDSESESKDDKVKKKSKTASKRLRKMQELENRLQETEFERAFRRDFWPDNV